MKREDYSNRELDSHFTFVKDALERIEKQVLKTNGRVNKLERNLLIVACVVGTILLLKFPQVISAIKFFI